MVFKNFIHYLINKYLKNYIERFDYEKVKFNLKSGNIFLENLRLKPDALAYLNIPATVAAGYLEQLKVTIPWNNLSTNPTEVHIDGLYLLIVPKNEMSQDLSKHYADKSKRVQQKLDNLRKATLENGTLDNKDIAFLERMRLQVMQNLVLTIRNLHISYEMKSPTKLGHPFSFGITFHYLEVITANDVKQTKRIKGNTLLIYKVKEVNSLSFYWNTKCKSRLEMPFEDVLNDLKSKIATKDYIPNTMEMRYVLHPINLLTESLITLKPKEHYHERSRLILDIQIPPINLHVDSEQISDILDFIKFQNYTTIYDRCQEYRTLLLQESFGIEQLTQEQKERIQFLESKLDIFQLAYIRHRVETEGNPFSPNKEKHDIPQEQQLKGNQVLINNTIPTTNTDNSHNLWGSWSKMKNSLTNLTKNHRKPTTTTASVQEKREFVFEDSPMINIEIRLNKVNLNLLPPATNTRFTTRGDDSDIIACVSISDAWVDMKKMSVTSRVECLIQLQSVRVLGIQRDKQYRPILLMPVLSSFSPLVHVQFELFSANQKFDYSLQLIIEPIKIIYDAPTVNQLVAMFEANEPVIWQPEQEIIRRTVVEMERNLSYEKRFDMTINLKGVSVLLPEHGITQQDFSMIRITFGNMILKSCLGDNDDSIDNSLFKEKVKERCFYVKYKFEWRDLRVLYSDSNKKRLYILRRTPLIDINFYKCIYSNDANLTNWLMGMKIAMGDIQLSKTVLTKLVFHLTSLPFLYSNMITIVKRINFYFTLFSPHATLIIDLSIYNCRLRFLMHPQISIRTDFHIYFTKTTDEHGTVTYTIAELNESTMIQHILVEMKQLSWLFYQNEHIKLIYSGAETKL